MSERLLEQFLRSLPHIHSPHAVLTALEQHYSLPLCGAGVLGFWEHGGRAGEWQAGHNMHLHPGIPKDFPIAYFAERKRHGTSSVSWKAWSTDFPFTLQEFDVECRRLKNERDRWVIQLYKAFGYHDGLYVSFRLHAAMYVSDKTLVLAPNHRIFLQAGAHAALGRILTLKPGTRPRRSRNVDLTERERELLQMRTNLTKRQIADKLGLTTGTVDQHFKNINKKLGEADAVLAMMKALRTGLIKFPRA